MHFMQGQGLSKTNLGLFVCFFDVYSAPYTFPSIKYALLRPQSQTACCPISGFLAEVFDCYTWSFIMAGISVQIAALLPLALFCLGEIKREDLT